MALPEKMANVVMSQADKAVDSAVLRVQEAEKELREARRAERAARAARAEQARLAGL